jgi:thiol-disulfide isomerase/thioredoxin
LVAAAPVLSFVAVGWNWYAKMTAAPGELDDFARCVAASGAKFYGADWCPHCQTQKEDFGSSVKFVPYVECAVRGTQMISYVCKKEQVESFPTWIFADGTRVVGAQSLSFIAEKTACKL